MSIVVTILSWNLLSSGVILFKINFLEKIFQEYLQSAKQFASRSGMGYRLLEKVIRR